MARSSRSFGGFGHVFDFGRFLVTDRNLGRLERKVKLGELTKKTLGRIVVSASRVLWSLVTPQEYFFFIFLNSCFPFPAMRLDSLESIFKVMTDRVLRIGCFCGWTKILSAVVKRISVFMVRSKTSKDCGVHKLTGVFSPVETAAGVITSAGFIPEGVPIPLLEEFKILRIDSGFLTARQWDKAVRFIAGLCNGMPLNSAFLHFPTSNRNLLHGLNFITGEC